MRIEDRLRPCHRRVDPLFHLEWCLAVDESKLVDAQLTRVTKLQELRIIRAKIEAQRVERTHGGVGGRKSAPGEGLEVASRRRLVRTALIVKVPARRTVQPRANAGRLDQVIAVALGHKGAKLGEVVVCTTGGSGPNGEVLAKSFRVVAEGPAVQDVDDRLRLAVRKRDRRRSLCQRGATLSGWPELIQKKGDGAQSSHGCLSQSGEL